MPGNPLPINFTSYLLWVVTAAILAVLLFLIVWIILRLQRHKRREQHRHLIREQWNNILASLLMDESLPEQRIELPNTFLKELQKPFVRSVLAAELVRTRQSLRGHMAETVIAVYNQMGLAVHTAPLLQSRKWHQQTKAIQQLSSMEQHQYHDAIYRYINHPNTWVRNEAQLGMLRLQGEQGLRFLNHLQRPLSEWQQFSLLHQLQLQPSKELPEIEDWLLSENHSVVLFSIRLCRMYQMFQYVDQIQKLQQHPEVSVRLEARESLYHWGLADLPTMETPGLTFYQTRPEAQTV